MNPKDKKSVPKEVLLSAEQALKDIEKIQNDPEVIRRAEKLEKEISSIATKDLSIKCTL